MEMRKVNKHGRSYRPGVGLDQDFKCLIIDRIISDGDERIMASYIPQSFTRFVNKLGDSVCIYKTQYNTVPPETIDPLARGQTSAPRSICAANSPRQDEFLNLVLDECDRTPR